MPEQSELARKLKDRLQYRINRLQFLKRTDVIQIQRVIGQEIRSFVKEYNDPFKELTESLGPTFEKITAYEKELEKQINRLKDLVEHEAEMAYDSAPNKPVTVRSQNRITLSELPKRTVLDKRVYRSKHAYTCPECDGSGALESGSECPKCEGEGEYYPIKGIMLEVI